jgi:peptide/nickel transport system substrate-binding protein
LKLEPSLPDDWKEGLNMMPRGLAVFTVAIFLVSACSSGTAAVPAPATSASGAVAPGSTQPTAAAAPAGPAKKGGTFIDTSFGDAPTMQPVISNDNSSNERIAVMFDSLRTQDPNTLEYKPNLAESWKFGADNLSMTYILKDNLTWSDGQPLTAADYKFTWDLLFDPKTKVPARSLLSNIVGPPDTPDAKTLVFKFKEVSAASTLYTDSWPAIPKHIFEGKDINDNPLNRDNTVGSGPFVLKEWVKDDHATFVANEKYFKGRPNLDQYIFRVVKDANAAYQALKAGEGDTAPIQAPDWDEATKLPNVNALSYYYYASSWDYIAYNLKNPFFQDKRVRQAIASAINKKAMIERVLLGHAKEQNSNYPATSPVFTDDVAKFPYDVNKAKQLLKDAGWTPGSDGILVKDGKPFKVRLHFNEGNKRRESIAALTQQFLKEVGIQVEVISEEFGAMLTRVRETKDFDMFVLGWIGGSDPDSAKAIWMSDGTQNYGGYSNPEVDKLYPQGDRVLDMQKERKPIYVQIQKLIAEDQPYVFLWTLEALRGFNKRIVGPQPVPLGTTETKWNVNEWYSTTGK